MTFENRTDQQYSQKVPKGAQNKTSKGSQKNTADDLLSGETEEIQKDEKAGTDIGFTGGQPKDDERGLDVSQYTGPGSKASSQFDDPKAPYHTGPGSGLSDKEKAKNTKEGNPKTENDPM